MPAPVRRVCLLGAESTGKTTLAGALARCLRDVVEPRVRAAVHRDRPDVDAPWTSAEFTHIARMQCWYEDFLAGLRDPAPVLRHGRVHDRGLPSRLPRTPHRRVRRAPARPYDLYLVCGLDVPWAHDGIREFARATSLDARAVPRAGRGERRRRGFISRADEELRRLAGRRRRRSSTMCLAAGDDATGPGGRAVTQVGTKLAHFRRQRRQQTRLESAVGGGLGCPTGRPQFATSRARG